MGLCSKNLTIRQITKIIDVDGFKKWYGDLEPAEGKQRITQCVENTIGWSLNMVLCCEEVTERTINTIYRVVCTAENQANYNIYCKILRFFMRPEIKKILFKKIKMLKMCYKMTCSFYLPTRNTRATRSFLELQKRQFDFASSFAILREQVCYDVLDGSTSLNYTLAKYLEFIENAWVGPDADQILLGLVLLRRPACCLLKEQF